MFYSIHMSALPLRTSRESKERNLVKRFFFIVITDFVCWIPIIVIKIVALAGVEISGALYAWVIVFILPVNSALNPLLYTLTTKLFKKKLLSKFTSVVFRPVQQPESTHSQSSLKNNTSLTRPAQECEMGLLKRYYPSQTRKSSSTHHSSHSDGRHHSNHRHSFSNRQSSQALWRRNNPGKLPQTYIGDPLKSRADGQL
ncbi:G-protein coupled receptor GRL101 [Aplysia californica]|uniref:G-protein coupled receptor GRL101 n=1 Tax=Aplysia californica TaxID=6500 RepID=A0ABM1A255_APLCA|nr:G-protein coupled receptor GRL101 [Aplysia californica]